MYYLIFYVLPDHEVELIAAFQSEVTYPLERETRVDIEDPRMKGKAILKVSYVKGSDFYCVLIVNN